MAAKKKYKTTANIAKKSLFKSNMPGGIFLELSPSMLAKLMTKRNIGGEMLKNPKKADLDKDGKLSSYEKRRKQVLRARLSWVIRLRLR